jgi:hypothetical protein
MFVRNKKHEQIGQERKAYGLRKPGANHGRGKH